MTDKVFVDKNLRVSLALQMNFQYLQSIKLF